MSDKQRRILEFLEGYYDECGFPPSMREIMDGCVISSTSVVAYNLVRLEKLGYILRDPLTARSITLLTRPVKERMTRVPIIGLLRPGSPIPDYQEWRREQQRKAKRWERSAV